MCFLHPLLCAKLLPPDEAVCSATAALETSPAILGREKAGAAPQPSTVCCCKHSSALASLGAPSAFKEDGKMEGWGGSPVVAVVSPLVKELLLLEIGAIREVPTSSRVSRSGTPKGFHWCSVRFSCQIVCVLSFQHNLFASGNNCFKRNLVGFK